jgi:dienelactone hydrolase
MKPELTPLLVDGEGKAVTTAEAWAVRRAELRRKWQDCIGHFPDEKAPLKSETLETEEWPDFVRQRVRYQIEDGVAAEAYLLTPLPAAEKRPAMVVFHQTTRTNFRQAAGLDESIPELMHGVQLVRRGYVVLCPRCFIFEDGAVEAVGFTRNVECMQQRHPDWTGMARMTWDAVRAADFLESLPGVDRGRIGCLGHSLGAKEALYAAAFDGRYRAAVYNDGGIGLNFNNWKAVWYLGPQICAPDFALEHHQLMALIAPRGFLFLAGEAEDGERSRPYFEAAQAVYRLLGAEANLGWLNHRAGHRFPPEAQAAAEAFLDRRLRPARQPSVTGSTQQVL